MVCSQGCSGLGFLFSQWQGASKCGERAVPTALEAEKKEMQPLGLASGVAGESFLKAVFAVPVPGAVGFCEVAPRATTGTSVCTVCYNSVNQSKPI